MFQWQVNKSTSAPLEGHHLVRRGDAQPAKVVFASGRRERGPSVRQRRSVDEASVPELPSAGEAAKQHRKERFLFSLLGCQQTNMIFAWAELCRTSRDLRGADTGRTCVAAGQPLRRLDDFNTCLQTHGLRIPSTRQGHQQPSEILAAAPLSLSRMPASVDQQVYFCQILLERQALVQYHLAATTNGACCLLLFVTSMTLWQPSSTCSRVPGKILSGHTLPRMWLCQHACLRVLNVCLLPGSKLIAV